MYTIDPYSCSFDVGYLLLHSMCAFHTPQKTKHGCPHATGFPYSQVKIHQLLLKSRFRTFNKDEANLFFVPSYVKCVRMTGALNDKEINQTYVNVNHTFA